MARLWSRPIGVSDLDGPDYWDFFGVRLVEHAAIALGAKLRGLQEGHAGTVEPPSLAAVLDEGFDAVFVCSGATTGKDLNKLVTRCP